MKKLILAAFIGVIALTSCQKQPTSNCTTVVDKRQDCKTFDQNGCLFYVTFQSDGQSPNEIMVTEQTYNSTIVGSKTCN